MPINIKVTGLEEFAKKAREAAKTLVDTPVPLGKTVLLTTACYAIGQYFLLKRFGVTIILARKT